MKTRITTFLLLIFLSSVNFAIAQPWLITGNGGTNPATNFLGTTDNKALIFRTNNIERMRITKTGNVGIGVTTPLQFLDVNGNINIALNSSFYMGNVRAIHYAGGGGNFFAGQGAGDMIQTGGQFNTAFGQAALNLNSTGDGNAAFGYLSLYNLDPGSNNTAMGFYSMHRCMSGNSNAAFGTSALENMQLSNNNTAIGAGAMGVSSSYGTNADGNTACGTNALGNLVLNSYNTAVGYASSLQNFGNGCITTLGWAADVNVSYNISNSTALGCQALITASDQVRVGNNSVNSIGGYVGWTTLPSDRRAKKNIKENVPGLAFINKLKPVTYNLDLDAIERIVQRVPLKDAAGKIVQPTEKEIAAKSAKEKILYTGFVAQDVQQAARELNYDFSGVDAAKNDKDMYGLRYAEFVVPLTKAVQELSKENDELKAENETLKQRLDKIENVLNANSNSSSAVASGTARLQQNIPNPAAQNTTIKYYIPLVATSAQLKFISDRGEVIKTVSIKTKGSGQYNFQISQLAAGLYTYALIIDGRSIDTKQMLITK